MKNIITVLEQKKDFLQKVKIEVLLNFQVVELNKQYVNYIKVNEDDGKSKTINTYIGEIIYEEDLPIIKSVPKEEVEQVLFIYNHVKDSILNRQK